MVRLKDGGYNGLDDRWQISIPYGAIKSGLFIELVPVSERYFNSLWCD